MKLLFALVCLLPWLWLMAISWLGAPITLGMLVWIVMSPVVILCVGAVAYREGQWSKK